jgi:hypothetical protein
MGLPEDETFDFLAGRVLEQVCFGQFQTQLRFDESVRVAVEGDIVVRQPGLDSIEVEDGRDIAAPLLALLGQAVSRVRVPDSNNLLIEFNWGTSVCFIDSEEHYESFQVHVGDRTIVI